jgi:hypothetical protein
MARYNHNWKTEKIVIGDLICWKEDNDIIGSYAIIKKIDGEGEYERIWGIYEDTIEIAKTEGRRHGYTGFMHRKNVFLVTPKKLNWRKRLA